MNRLVLALMAGFALSTSAAEAAPFSIFLGGNTSVDGSISFTVTGDTTAPVATLTYDEYGQNDSLDGEYRTTFTDNASQLQLGPLGVSIDPYPANGTTYTRSVTLSSVLFDYTQVDTSDFDPNASTELARQGYSLSFNLSETVYSTGQPADFNIDSVSLILNKSASLATIPDLSVSQGLLAPVPLPGALPLFGAALMVAAGVTSAARRLRHTAEAPEA